ncbi:MAG: YitT family protein, partial [Lachnospiraceae bacterium]
MFSLAQVLMTSLLLGILPARPLFDDVLLNICFGGTLYGISAVTALRGNASTG